MNFAYFFRMLSYNTCDHLINVLTSEDEQALEVICQSKLLETKKEWRRFSKCINHYKKQFIIYFIVESIQ